MDAGTAIGTGPRRQRSSRSARSHLSFFPKVDEMARRGRRRALTTAGRRAAVIGGTGGARGPPEHRATGRDEVAGSNGRAERANGRGWRRGQNGQTGKGPGPRVDGEAPAREDGHAGGRRSCAGRSTRAPSMRTPETARGSRSCKPGLPERGTVDLLPKERVVVGTRTLDGQAAPRVGA